MVRKRKDSAAEVAGSTSKKSAKAAADITLQSLGKHQILIEHW